MNIDNAKENMVQHQIRPIGITDSNLLAALYEIPKEAFFPKKISSLAYSEFNPLDSDGQNSLSTFSITKILQFLSLQKHHSVLQLGCSSGYLTALLAKLALSVELCDVDEKTIDTTKHCLKSLGIYNVKYRNSHNWTKMMSDQAYDIVILTPGCERSYQLHLNQLSILGRLLYFIKHPGYTKAVMLDKTKKDDYNYLEIADFYSSTLEPTQYFSF